ncbi:MAG: hypothetical protein HZB59_03855 [Ignavibacteriales bacterium]|nr:hypothetical protein [Ignavibacteriales bacterium]
MEYSNLFYLYVNFNLMSIYDEEMGIFMIDYILEDLNKDKIENDVYIFAGKSFDYENGKVVFNEKPNWRRDPWRTIPKGSPILSPNLTSNQLKILKPENDNGYIRAKHEYYHWSGRLNRRPDNEEYKNIVDFLARVLKEFEKWYDENDLDLPSVDHTLNETPVFKSDSEREKDNIIRIQNEKIKLLTRKLRNTIRAPKEDLVDLATKHRFKNGKINYSQIAKQLGVNNKTAKSWCDFYKIE